MTSIVILSAAILVIVFVTLLWRLRLRNIRQLRWGDLSARPKMVRCCRIYLKRQGWDVVPPWHLMTDLHIRNSASSMNLVCVSAGKQVHDVLIKDAVATAHATGQTTVLITAAALSPRDVALAQQAKLPIFYYKDLAGLAAYRTPK